MAKNNIKNRKSYTKEIINSHVEFEIEANDAIVMVNDI